MSYFDIPKIQYEGPKSENPLSFKWYNASEKVEGKSMKEHLRFGAAYWHCMRNELSDLFGAGTAQMPWDDRSNSLSNALKRVDVFFELLEKLDIDYYCFPMHLHSRQPLIRETSSVLPGSRGSSQCST